MERICDDVGNLKLHYGPGGYGHHLDNRRVSCGTQLRLLVSTEPEQWVWARYESNLIQPVRVRLYTVFGIVIPDATTVLRWPTEADR